MPEFSSFWNWLGWAILIFGGLAIIAASIADWKR